MNAYRSVCSVCIGIAVVLVNVHMPVVAQQEQKTLHSFGVRVQHGQPVYPLPSNVALGLFNPDPLLDLAYYNEARLPDGQGKMQVWQNLGNGLFDLVWERGVNSEIAKVEFRKNGRIDGYLANPNSWSDLLIVYDGGHEELVSYRTMLNQVQGSSILAPSFSGTPPLNLREVWRSEPSYGNYRITLGDIDNDSKNEVAYWFYGDPGDFDSTNRLVIYENSGNDTYSVDWDTVFYRATGSFCMTDLNNDGRKELVLVRRDGVAILECFGPDRYRFNTTNIGFSNRPNQSVFKIVETDYDHDGTKELIVLVTDPSAVQDATLIYVAKFIGKGPTQGGWMYAFDQELIRDHTSVGDIAVGQLDGIGNDEIVIGNGDFGIGESVPIRYFWRGPTGWIKREIFTGLSSGGLHPLFVDLDSDSTKELVAGGIGPFLHGSLFALKWLHDTTYSIAWVDSNLDNSPTNLRTGAISGTSIIGISNDSSSHPGIDATSLRLYNFSGANIGIWTMDSASIGDFVISDIDGDGNSNVVSALNVFIFPPNSHLIDYEAELVLSVAESPMPSTLELRQNIPNPFNPNTTIRYSLPQEGQTSLKIFDILGREVVALVSQREKAGVHTVNWDARAFPSGIYFYKLESNSLQLVRKMALIK